MLSFSAVAHHREIPDNFVYLREVIPNIALDLRYAGANNFTGARVPGYDADVAFCTLEAAYALRKAQLELAYAGLALKVFDAYRPQRAVDHFVRWAHDAADLATQAEYYPNLRKEEIFPQGYLFERSSHSRGSTFDLTIIDAHTGLELDMGTPFDFFDPLSWPGSPAVSAAQRAHRMLLRSVMTRHGFVAVDEEWWHFTLKDEPYPDAYFDFPISQPELPPLVYEPGR